MKNPVDIAKKGYNRVLKVDDLIVKTDHLTNLANNIIAKQNDLEQQISATHASLEELKNLIRTSTRYNELYFYALYQKPGENISDINRRFLGHLPQASGPLRTLQLGMVKLLKALISLCKQHDLFYIIHAGTLLGAVRQGGFIPWDDDVDVGMFRKDIIKLRELLQNDPHYRVTLVYDYIVKSRQFRFRTTDPDNPCFIDLMIYDYGIDENEFNWEKEWVEKKNLIAQKLESEDPKIINAWRKAIYVDADSPLGQKLKPLYEKYYDTLINPNLDEHNSQSIIFGYDNLMVNGKRIFNKEQIFPTVTLTFEGIKVAAPRNYMEYLKRDYKNIYELPGDIANHFQHIQLNEIAIQAIEKFLK